MSGSKSPNVPPLPSSSIRSAGSLLNGHRSPQDGRKAEVSREKYAKSSGSGALFAPQGSNAPTDMGTDSEAETLIDSPVKRIGANRRDTITKGDKPTKTRIGSLPVPGGDDEESEVHESPVESVEPNGAMPTHKALADSGPMDVDSDQENKSGTTGPLSSLRSAASGNLSRPFSKSRSSSGQRDIEYSLTNSPNPRKRKHRASSFNLPNKRASEGSSKTNLRGGPSADGPNGESPPDSPKLRSHRRAVSTQSGILDGVTSDGTSRKRRKHATHDMKSFQSGWDESDASSEATSHGNIETRRPQRVLGRSTSTPGRPTGREHKRHVNKYGFTRLAEACEAGDLESVKEWKEKDPDQLELAEFAQNKPLQIAALNGNEEVVAYLIDQGCQIDCANVDKDTPLIDAAENGHLAVVKILLNAGVDPLRQNLKGQQALDVVTDDTDDADQIRTELRRAIESWNSDDAKLRREEEEVVRHQAGTNKGLHFMARTYENLLKLVTVNDRNGVREFLDARVPVDNAIVAAAAKTGDVYLVNMLLAEMTEKKAHQKAEKPMISVLGTSHFDMVKALTELDTFDPLWQTRQGRTWPELAEERNGPNVKQEKDLLQRLYNDARSVYKRGSSSPVVKREHGKRRHLQQPVGDRNNNSEGEESGPVPKRKNGGRRLMSRRDMRAVNGKNASGSESGEASTSDAEYGTEEPSTAKEVGEKAPSRSTTPEKGSGENGNLSSHLIEESASSSHRPSNLDNMDSDALHIDLTRDDNSSSNEKQGHVRRVARPSGIHADRISAGFEAEIKRQRAAIEARKAQEDEMQREAQEREAEAAREFQEQENASREMRERVLASLPSTLSEVLDPASDFDLQGDEAVAHVLSNFTPLLLARQAGSGTAIPPHVTDDDAWVLNAQAAPLLGKPGLEILLPENDDMFGEVRTFSLSWNTFGAFSSSKEQSLIVRALKSLPTGNRSEESSTSYEEGRTTFEEEMQELADCYNAERDSQRILSESPAAVFFVRLTDVLEKLHPALKDIPIQVESIEWPHHCVDTAETLDNRGIEDFVTRFTGGFWAARRQQIQTVNHADNGKMSSQIENVAQGVTEVVLVGEK